jgi:hypothetical protein
VALVAVQLRSEAFGESGPAASAAGHAQGRETATHQVLQPVRTKLEELRAPIAVLVRAHPARARSKRHQRSAEGLTQAKSTIAIIMLEVHSKLMLPVKIPPAIACPRWR